MAISKKLLLATAMLATCVSSMKLQGAGDGAIGRTIGLTDRDKVIISLTGTGTTGTLAAAGGIGYLRIAKQLKNITPAIPALTKQIKNLRFRGYFALAQGALLLSAPLYVGLHAKKHQKKNNPSV